MSDLISAVYTTGKDPVKPYARLVFDAVCLPDQVKAFAELLGAFISDRQIKTDDSARSGKEQQEVEYVNIDDSQLDRALLGPNQLKNIYLVQPKQRKLNPNYRVTQSDFSEGLSTVHIFTTNHCAYDEGTLEAFIESIKPKEQVIF